METKLSPSEIYALYKQKNAQIGNFKKSVSRQISFLKRDGLQTIRKEGHRNCYSTMDKKGVWKALYKTFSLKPFEIRTFSSIRKKRLKYLKNMSTSRYYFFYLFKTHFNAKTFF